MEKRVDSLVFRRITYADFRHINKIGGEEEGGGGQSYIDFPIAEISLQKWFDFLGRNTGVGAGNRPNWEFPINSFGLGESITLKIYQRRAASVSIASQKIHSKATNRVPSWHPENGFPDEYNSNIENLVIYIAKLIDGDYWAGWFLQDQIHKKLIISELLSKMFTQESAGYLKFTEPLFVETSNQKWPFNSSTTIYEESNTAEENIETSLELQDTSPRLQELIDNDSLPEFVDRIMRIRQRNNRLVKNLKNLYEGRCQITGEKFTFTKKNGELYSEVHHLIPLGENGSDSYANAIVVSPLIHRMLHYAEVSIIDLNDIVDRQLTITINNVSHTITWHPDHASIIDNALSD